MTKSQTIIDWIEAEFTRTGYRPRLNSVWLQIAQSHKRIPAQRRQQATQKVYQQVMDHYGITDD